MVRSRPAEGERAHDSPHLGLPRQRAARYDRGRGPAEPHVVRVTDETFPIICFQSYGVTTEAQLEAVKPIYDRLYKRNEPFISVSDARLADHSAQQLKLWA